MTTGMVARVALIFLGPVNAPWWDEELSMWSCGGGPGKDINNLLKTAAFSLQTSENNSNLIRNTLKGRLRVNNEQSLRWIYSFIYGFLMTRSQIIHILEGMIANATMMCFFQV